MFCTKGISLKLWNYPQCCSTWNRVQSQQRNTK